MSLVSTGLFIKDVHSQGGEEEVVQCGIFRITFWCKNFGLFEIYGASARTKEG